jgi:hypothetical protein
MTDKKMYAPYAPGAPVFPRQQPINEEQVVQECIDCVTDWANRNIGNISSDSRGLISNNIKEFVVSMRRNPDRSMDIFRTLITSYHNLDFDVIEKRWAELKAEKPTEYTDHLVYYYGRNASSAKDDWLSRLRQYITNLGGIPRVTYLSIGGSRDLIEAYWHTKTSHTGFVGSWGRDESAVNNVIRVYISCFLDLFLALFPEYVNIQPEEIPRHVIGGSKIKNKNKKTKKRKTKRSKKGKRSRRY